MCSAIQEQCPHCNDHPEPCNWSVAKWHSRPVGSWGQESTSLALQKRLISLQMRRQPFWAIFSRESLWEAILNRVSLWLSKNCLWYVRGSIFLSLNIQCTIERVTFGWKWKFKLLQANMDVCHTQEQQIFRFRVFYVTNYQLILTFVSYKFHYLKMVPKRVKNSTFCKFIHNTTCVYWNDALRFHNVIWIFWDSFGWQNQIS